MLTLMYSASLYYSNHLGSAAYLTNDAGQVTQTLNYLPYGEDWVDIQHYSGARYSNMELYTFTGKEQDSETGYGYFGARYMDHELMAMWLSVDPMADKYPGISPYAYCSWNPIKLIDPDGRDGVVVVNQRKKEIVVKVNLVFYTSSSQGRKWVERAADNYVKNIKNAWKDTRIKVGPADFTLKFDINYNVDMLARDESKRQYNGTNNYIDIVFGNIRSNVTNCHDGKWKYTEDPQKNSGAHEFGHIVGLRDRYVDFTDENNKLVVEKDIGWEHCIMANSWIASAVDNKTIKQLLNVFNNEHLIQKGKIHLNKFHREQKVNGE